MKNNTNLSILIGYEKCHVTNGILRYYGTFIFLVGIISTVLSICVFARKQLRRKSCCFYFLILAISDAIHLLTTVIEHLPYTFHIDLIIIHTSICKIMIFLIYFSNHLSNIVLTLASIDRFILIHCPARSKNICNIHKAKCFLLISILVLFIANSHLLVGYERIYSNEFYDCNIRTENIFYRNLFQFYDTYVESLFFVIIPFLIMFICSLLIIFQIFETRKTIRYNNKGKYYYYTFYTNESIRQTVKHTIHEEGKTRLRDKDIQLCCMLIGTTFAFIILCLPTEINDLFNYTTHEHTCYGWFRKVILMLMQQTYYASHLYIYTLTGQLFRKHLYAVIFGRYRHQTIINKENQSFPARFLANFNQNYSKNSNEKPKFSTTNTQTYKPTIIHENSFSNDPSQRLLSISK